MKVKYIAISAFLILSAAYFSENTSASGSSTMTSSSDIVPYTSPFNYTKEEVKSIVEMIIEDKTGMDVRNLPNDTYLVKDLGIDSLGMVEIIIECENFFQISFNEADALQYDYTIGQFVEMIWHFCTSDGDYNG